MAATKTQRRVKASDITLAQARKLVIEQAKFMEAYYRSWPLAIRPQASRSLMRAVRLLKQKEAGR